MKLHPDKLEVLIVKKKLDSGIEMNLCFYVVAFPQKEQIRSLRVLFGLGNSYPQSWLILILTTATHFKTVPESCSNQAADRCKVQRYDACTKISH